MAAWRGPMEPGFNPLLTAGPSRKAADLSTQPQQHHTTSEWGAGRRLCTHPGLTMSLGGGVGSPELVLLTQLQTGRLQGLPQRHTCPSIPVAAINLFLSKAANQEIPV